MPECTPPWEENNGTCYFWSQDKLFWGAAEERCRELGGHLATVTTEKEHNYLRLKVGEIKTIQKPNVFFRDLFPVASGSERQTKLMKATGHGLTAAPGTSPDGAWETVNSNLTTQDLLMGTARTVHFSMAKIQQSRVGKMLLATSKKENLCAADQSAQVRTLLEDPFKSWLVVFQERQSSTRLLPLPVSFLFWYFWALLCWCISCTGTKKELPRSLLKMSTRTQCTVWTTLRMESILTMATRRSKMRTSIMEHSWKFISCVFISYLTIVLPCLPSNINDLCTKVYKKSV